MNKKTSIILSVVAVLFFSCGPETKKEEKENKESGAPVMPETTEYNYTFDADTLPKGYVLDRMAVEDTIKRVKVNLEYLNETEGDFLFTEALITVLLAEAEKELSYYEIPKDSNQTSG